MAVFLQLEETLNLVKIIEETGVKAIGVHGRYMSFVAIRWYDLVFCSDVTAERS